MKHCTNVAFLHFPLRPNDSAFKRHQGLTLDKSTIRFNIRHSALVSVKQEWEQFSLWLSVFISLSLQGRYHVNRLRNPSLFAMQTPKQNMRDGSQSSWRQREPPPTNDCCLLWMYQQQIFNHLWTLIQWGIMIRGGSRARRLYLHKTIKCNKSVLVTLLVDKSLHYNLFQQNTLLNTAPM